MENKAGKTFASDLGRPWAIAAYGDGYAVSEPDSGTMHLVGASGTVSKLDADFQHPAGLASDEDGNLYVADAYAGNTKL